MVFSIVHKGYGLNMSGFFNATIIIQTEIAFALSETYFKK